MKDTNQHHRPVRRPGGSRPQRPGRTTGEVPHSSGKKVSVPRKPQRLPEPPTHEKTPRRHTRRVPRTLSERLRLYLPVVIACNGLGLIVALAVSLFLVVAGFAEASTIPTSLSIGWSVINLIPVVASGTSIGFLPLLPALGFFAFMAWRYRQAIKHRVTVKDLQVLTILVVVVPLIISWITQMVLGLYNSADSVMWSPWWMVILKVVMLHWFAFCLAIPVKVWRALLRKAGLDLRLSLAFQRAWRFLCLLALAGFVLYAVMIVLHFSRMREAFATYTGTNDGLAIFGLGLLTVAYLPNAIFATAGVLLGSVFQIGETSLSIMAIAYGPLPIFPTLSVLPLQEASWMLVLFVATVATCLYVYITKPPQLLDIVETTLAAPVLVAVFGVANSGNLGVYGFTGLNLFLTLLLVAAWLMVSGLITWLVGRWAIAHGKRIEVEVPVVDAPKPQKRSSAETTKPSEHRHSAASQNHEQSNPVAAPDQNHKAQDGETQPPHHGEHEKSPEAQQGTAQEELPDDMPPADAQESDKGDSLPIKRPQESQPTSNIPQADRGAETAAQDRDAES